MATDPSPALLDRIGARVRELRHERGLTQSELAQRSGVSVRFLGQLEAGEGNISLGRLAEVAAALGVPLGALVSEGPDPSALALWPEVADLVRQHGEDEARRVLSLARSLLHPGGQRVALLGIRGAGKTTIGERLARRLRVPFVELDERIEKEAGLSLGAIFELHGEDYYRRLERQALTDLLARPSFVVATGGSLVTASEHYALLRRLTATVWLKATPEDHWQRVVAQGDARPMRRRPQAMDELRALFAARQPLYEQAALTVDTHARTVDQTVDDVAAVLAG